MRIYGASFGESYSFQFGYDPEQKRTFVTVEIDYSVFGGRGFIWIFPQETMDNWAKAVRTQNVILESKQTPAFFEKYQLILALASRPTQIVDKYCIMCGYKGTNVSQFCGLCGSSMVNENS
jgi:hypothetical protein